MLSKNPTETVSPAKADATRCACGDPTCNGRSCGLDCLMQPRFFCGQLLTDQDLTTLRTWTQQKFRLSRYRDGWGVACGLNVRCDHEKSGHIIIEPG